MDTPSAITLPERIGKYQIVRQIGLGGMGEVWLATDPLGSQVAVKKGGRDARLSDREMKRFMQEAKALSLIQHRNICRIYGVEIHENIPYMVM